MKYIRTQNNIYKADRVCVVNYNGTDCVEILERGCGAMVSWYETIIDEADTIEELCDGVIEKCLSGNRFCPIEKFNKQEAIKCMNIDVNKGDKEFYFGIFVEKNDKIDFISVAKMNSDGVLEYYDKR